jgi:hypothetical protein
MPNINVFLAIEPTQHYIAYSSYVLREIISKYRKPWQRIIELKGTDANPDRIFHEIELNDPILVVSVGHGSEIATSCECTQVYLATTMNIEKMSGRVIMLNSCFTAKGLGPALIQNGTKAYFGNSEEFLFYMGLPPGWGRAVKAPFLCEFQAVASLLEGKTTGEAQQDRLKRYDEEIAYWTEGGGKNLFEAPLIANILTIDKNMATFLGDENVKVSEVAEALETPAEKPEISLIPAVAAMVIGSVLGFFSAKTR